MCLFYKYHRAVSVLFGVCLLLLLCSCYLSFIACFILSAELQGLTYISQPPYMSYSSTSIPFFSSHSLSLQSAQLSNAANPALLLISFSIYFGIFIFLSFPSACSVVWLAMFFAVGNGFFKAHNVLPFHFAFSQHQLPLPPTLQHIASLSSLCMQN